MALKAQQYQILKVKDPKALGTSLLIIPELRVFFLTKRHVGSGNEIDHTTKIVVYREFRVLTLLRFLEIRMRIHEKRPTRMRTLRSLKSVYFGWVWWWGMVDGSYRVFSVISRLHFLDQTFLTKCAFFRFKEPLQYACALGY